MKSISLTALIVVAVAGCAAAPSDAESQEGATPSAQTQTTAKRPPDLCFQVTQLHKMTQKVDDKNLEVLTGGKWAPYVYSHSDGRTVSGFGSVECKKGDPSGPVSFFSGAAAGLFAGTYGSEFWRVQEGTGATVMDVKAPNSDKTFGLEATFGGDGINQLTYVEKLSSGAALGRVSASTKGPLYYLGVTVPETCTDFVLGKFAPGIYYDGDEEQVVTRTFKKIPNKDAYTLTVSARGKYKFVEGNKLRACELSETVLVRPTAPSASAK